MELGEVEILAQRLLILHGLDDWSFGFNNNKRRLGVCRQDDKRIELSTHYVKANNQDHIVDTVLHEIAHALVGVNHGHDRVWKTKCLEIGCRPQACDNSANMPEGNWLAICPGCERRFAQHRRPRRLRGLYCVACGPDKGRLRFADRTVVKVPQPTKAILASARQLLLKLDWGWS